MIGYLDDVIRPLVLVLPKMSGYVKTFKHKGRDKNNKLLSWRIDDDKLLQKYKTIWTKIEDFKNIELDASPVYDGRYIKPKKNMWWQIECTRRWCRIWIFYSHFYWFFIGLWQQILPASIFRQLCLQNCRQTNDRLDDKLLETDED